MSIHDDEMLLAEMLAEVHSRGLGWCSCRMFATLDGRTCDRADAKRVCALGALSFLDPPVNRDKLCFIVHGNDTDGYWSRGGDVGESLGWAFRQAMEDES